MTGGSVAIGTRGSALAMAQARLVQAALERDGRRTRTVVVETAGDRRAPDTAWGEGAFVAAIERALLERRVDVAVHSAKDVPTEEDPRLAIGAYLRRADPRDALVVRADMAGRRVADLPPGTRVGTDSPRRTAFLRASRPDLVVHPLHGNVDTRLRRLDAGETDALLLACAGLDRLGLGDRIAERLDPDLVPPAPGQGAIAVQIRRDDARMIALAAAIDDRPTRLAVEAERAFLAASGGGCRSPIGALATIAGDELRLLGGHAASDGSRPRFARRRGPSGDGVRLAGELALELSPGIRRRVLVTRAADQAAGLERALRDVGLEPILVPAIAVEIDGPGGSLDDVAGRVSSFAWVVVTSANGARALVAAAGRIGAGLGGPSWAAVGPATAAILRRAAVDVGFQPSRSRATDLAAELPIEAGERVLVVRGDLAGDGLAAALRARGAEVEDPVAYRTAEAPPSSRALLERALTDGPPDAVTLTSGSTVRGLRSLAAATGLDIASIPAVCIGPETAAEARRAGFHVVAVSGSPEAEDLAATTAAALAAPSQEIA